jgi:hypothetical protein
VAGIAAFAVARGNGLGHGLEEASLVGSVAESMNWEFGAVHTPTG